ncbi:hypothetical protein GQR58_003399 [Nymphon striatum]|nr:hypothetical protein GQR58_003399 [Nymphon striatum]
MLVVVLTVFTIKLSQANSSGPDLHWLWHDRCASCHGHSGDFSRSFLKVSKGELQGRHHITDLRLFLDNHYLAGKEVDTVYNMLLAQASIEARFKNECSRCHETAVEFVRESLILREGVLYSRELNIPTSDTLEHHRRLESKDVEFFTKQLTRVANEVYRP